MSSFPPSSPCVGIPSSPSSFGSNQHSKYPLHHQPPLTVATAHTGAGTAGFGFGFGFGGGGGAGQGFQQSSQHGQGLGHGVSNGGGGFEGTGHMNSNTNTGGANMGFGFGFGGASQQRQQQQPQSSVGMGWGQQPHQSQSQHHQSSSSLGWRFPAGTVPQSSSTLPFPSTVSSSSPSAPLTSTNVPTNRRRRRRSSTPPEELGSSSPMSMSMDVLSASGAEPRKIRALKRGRFDNSASSGDQGAGASRGSAGVASNQANVSGARTPVGGKAQEEVDLGKALTQLSKPSLLSLLHSLLSTQPSLRPVVLSLLPPPSLESLITSVQDEEKKVVEGLPKGWLVYPTNTSLGDGGSVAANASGISGGVRGGGKGMRKEYVWGRVRGKVESYVNESKRVLGVYFPLQQQQQQSSSNATVDASPNNTNLNDESKQPDALFTLLNSVTSSYLRLEVVLPFSSSSSDTTSAHQGDDEDEDPSPLQSHLLPILINAWHTFITQLHKLIHDEGRMVGREMCRAWLEKVDTLTRADDMNVGNNTKSMLKKALEPIRNRLLKEVGAFVGVRKEPVPLEGLMGMGQSYGGNYYSSTGTFGGGGYTSPSNNMNNSQHIASASAQFWGGGHMNNNGPKRMEREMSVVGMEEEEEEL